MTEKKRISQVTTKTGDRGNTKLATGRTISKSSPLVQAIGSVDELNSHIGMLSCLIADRITGGSQQGSSHQTIQTTLTDIQQALFDIGAVFAMEGQFTPPATQGLEQITATINADLPPLTEFVIPGGGISAAQSHICRTVCRRAESDVWRLIEGLGDSLGTSSTDALIGTAQYLNRLSDYLFVLARQITQTPESQWQGPK
ncbi:MAG: cob(I)yrinic acid a,c-diamide adenosyltransferase [Pseudomonadales bacterium]|nr:cob(I)yrinic acid a,c-diamide adenosyltransferase [Pseudomonadales bacterium]